MENIAIIALLMLAIGVAVWGIVRAKRKGQKCVGCPYSGGCSGCCGGEEQTK